MKSQDQSSTQCQLHNEPVILIAGLKSQPQKESRLCSICINNLDKTHILKDFDDQSTAMKSEAREERFQSNHKNIKILEKLISDIEEYQKQFVQSLYQLKNKLKQWVVQISDERQNILQSIESINTIFLREFKSELRRLDKLYAQRQDLNRKDIQDQLQYLLSPNKISDIAKIVSSLDFETIIQIQESVSQTRITETKKCDFICLQHNREASFLDLNEYRITQNQTGCLYCRYNYVEDLHPEQKQIKITNCDISQILYYYHDNYEKAIKVLNQSLDLNPKDHHTLYCKGDCLRMLDRYDELLICLDKALEIDPKHINSFFDKGDCLKMLNRYDESLIWLDKALEIDPKHVNSLDSKGDCLMMQGNYSEALIWYNNALLIDPTLLSSLDSKKLCEEKLGIKQ